MTLYALLHGGMHDGSSWDQVATILRARGYDVVAPDLPVDDDSAGAEDWTQIAIDAINSAIGRVSDDVVIVGHSLAGLCLPVLATRRRVKRMIFLAGLIPTPGTTFVDQLAESPDAIAFAATLAPDGGPFGLTFESVQNGFYHDCPEPVARHAFAHLRGQAFTVFTERCPIDRWPDVAAGFVIMKDDRALSSPWIRRRAERYSGAEIFEMDGGHSPFFARPYELCDVLVAASGHTPATSTAPNC